MAAATGGGAGYDSVYPSGGAGGKFRRNSGRKPPATPYARPANAIRKSSEAGRASWLFKTLLVDPASKIISSSAHKFFSSVFKKQQQQPPSLPPPLLPVSEANDHELRDGSPAAVSHNTPEPEERVNNEWKLHNGSDTNEINDLEHILMQKTFTRAEIDRLTELMRSRTVDASVEDEKKKYDTSTSKLVATYRGVGGVSVQETETQSLIERASSPVDRSTILEEDVATPADVAKAYMGNRTSNITPSRLGLHSQTSIENVASLTNLPSAKKSPIMALVPNSALNFNSASRVSGNGYLTPGLRGRSALYNMARTPYSRVHRTTTNKAAGFGNEGNAGPSGLTQWSLENNIPSAGKQVSKRRSSVFDNDVGSPGPIRRIRQKTAMVSPSRPLSLRSPQSFSCIPVTLVGSEFTQLETSSIQKSLQLNESKHNSSKRGIGENGNDIASTSSAGVPSQSSQFAKKIFDQLDKFVPSPKEKSSELKLVKGLETSTKLTHNMLNGRARKSMEVVDSTLMHGLHGAESLDNHVLGTLETTSPKQVSVYENGSSKVSILGDKLGAKANGVITELSTKDITPNPKAAVSVTSKFDAVTSQKKRAFRMSAHEDSLELDVDDDSSIKVVSAPLATNKEKASQLESKATIPEATVDKSLVSSPELNPPTCAILQKPITFGASDTSPTVEKDSCMSFTFEHSSTATQGPALPTQESSLLKKLASPNESTGAPVFSFGSKSANEATPFTSSTTSATELVVPKFGSQSETLNSAPEAAGRVHNISSTQESDKGIKDGSQKAGVLLRKQENAMFSVSASSTPSVTVGASSSNSSLNNGFLASSTSLSSVAVVSPTSVFGSSSNTATTTADVTRTCQPPAATSTFSAPSAFHFGSGTSAALPQTSVSLLSETSGISTDAELKAKDTPPFGSLANSTFGKISAHTGSSGTPIVFGAPAPSTAKPSSSDNNLFQSSNSSAPAISGSMSSQTSTGTGVVTSSQSTPMQFTSTSPTFGLTGSTSLSFGGSIFSSSAGVNPFSSSSTFGTSSSSPFSATTSTLTSGSGTMSSFFSSSSQSTPFSSGFGSTSSSSPFTFSASPAASGGTGTSSSGTFTFTGSSAASGGAVNAPFTFGSSLGSSSSSLFSFTSASATTSSVPNPASFVTSNAVGTFGSSSPSNDQMNMEDSMAEDTTLQASTPAVAGFGQPTTTNFMFGAPSGPSSFQLNGQLTPASTQNPSPFTTTTTQNLSPFQAAGSLGFSAGAGGSFSLGTGGGEKSVRRTVKINRNKNRKK